jgi:DnaJ-class molecular chaperone
MLFSVFFENWAKRREEKVEANLMDMKNKGKCPECRGTGLNYPYHIAAVDYMPPTDLECPSCNGSGSFGDWAETHQRTDLM